MGLDMYLNRMPRCGGATANDVSNVENFLSWMQAKEKGSPYANCTFEEWCGAKNPPSQKQLVFYEPFYVERFAHWDTEHRYGHYHIMEDVGYWRKANSIHNWFVENIQDGVDDCEYHREVTEEDLRELLNICHRVLDSCKLVDGQVCNGYRYENGKEVPIMEDGKHVEDSTIAKALLPSASGFFFGGTDYDEYYVNDIEKTIKIVTNVLETTDFETQMLYYRSSW